MVAKRCWIHRHKVDSPGSSAVAQKTPGMITFWYIYRWYINTCDHNATLNYLSGNARGYSERFVTAHCVRLVVKGNWRGRRSINGSDRSIIRRLNSRMYKTALWYWERLQTFNCEWWTELGILNGVIFKANMKYVDWYWSSDEIYGYTKDQSLFGDLL